MKITSYELLRSDWAESLNTKSDTCWTKQALQDTEIWNFRLDRTGENFPLMLVKGLKVHLEQFGLRSWKTQLCFSTFTPLSFIFNNYFLNVIILPNPKPLNAKIKRKTSPCLEDHRRDKLQPSQSAQIWSDHSWQKTETWSSDWPRILFWSQFCSLHFSLLSWCINPLSVNYSSHDAAVTQQVSLRVKSPLTEFSQGLILIRLHRVRRLHQPE